MGDLIEGLKIAFTACILAPIIAGICMTVFIGTVKIIMFIFGMNLT